MLFMELFQETQRNVKGSVFWDITSCSPLKINRRFGGCLLPINASFFNFFRLHPVVYIVWTVNTTKNTVNFNFNSIVIFNFNYNCNVQLNSF
jgi:hypothetical protein